MHRQWVLREDNEPGRVHPQLAGIDRIHCLPRWQLQLGGLLSAVVAWDGYIDFGCQIPGWYAKPNGVSFHQIMVWIVVSVLLACLQQRTSQRPTPP